MKAACLKATQGPMLNVKANQHLFESFAGGSSLKAVILSRSNCIKCQWLSEDRCKQSAHIEESSKQATKQDLTSGGARWTMQFTCSCTGLLPRVGSGAEEGVVVDWGVEGAAKAAQAGDDSREGRWLLVGQSAMMTTGAAGAASRTYTHYYLLSCKVCVQ